MSCYFTWWVKLFFFSVCFTDGSQDGDQVTSFVVFLPLTLLTCHPKRSYSFSTVFCVLFMIILFFSCQRLSFYCVCKAFCLENANEIALSFTIRQPQCICALLNSFVVSVINIKMPYRNRSVLIRTQYWWKTILMLIVSGTMFVCFVYFLN